MAVQIKANSAEFKVIKTPVKNFDLSNGFTMMARVKINYLPSIVRLIGFFDPVDGNDDKNWIGFGWDGDSVYVNIGNQLVGSYFAQDTYQPLDSSWHSLTLSANATECKLYVDGEIVWTGDNSLSTFLTSLTTHYFCVGGFCEANNSDFEIEDVRMYCKILNGAEIKTIHLCNGHDGIKDNLVVFLPLNDYPAIDIHEESGQKILPTGTIFKNLHPNYIISSTEEEPGESKITFWAKLENENAEIGNNANVIGSPTYSSAKFNNGLDSPSTTPNLIFPNVVPISGITSFFFKPNFSSTNSGMSIILSARNETRGFLISQYAWGENPGFFIATGETDGNWDSLYYSSWTKSFNAGDILGWVVLWNKNGTYGQKFKVFYKVNDGILSEIPMSVNNDDGTSYWPTSVMNLDLGDWNVFNTMNGIIDNIKITDDISILEDIKDNLDTEGVEGLVSSPSYKISHSILNIPSATSEIISGTNMISKPSQLSIIRRRY